MEAKYIIAAGLIVFVILCIIFCPFDGADEDSAFEAYQRDYYPTPPAPPTPEYVAFNLNDAIKVKLTEKGYRVWSDGYDNMPISIGVDELKARADENGYCEFQAWVFVQTFGPATNITSDLYNTNVLIRSKDITEVKKSTF